MRKLYVLLCLMLLTSVAGFSQLITDQFEYTPDATLGLSAQSGGLWVRTNSGDSILVTAGSLSYPGLAASAGNKISYAGSGADDFRQFGNQTAGTVYAAFLVNVNALGTLNTTGGYFVAFTEGTSSTNLGGCVWVRLSSTAGKYNLGISTRSSSAVSWLADELDPGVTNMVVAGYEINVGTANDVARIWLNPTALGGAAPTPSASAVPGTDMANVGRFQVRQDATNTTPALDFDELRIGTDWATVTPALGGGGTPVLSTGTMTAFGNVCVNTTAGPNNFTITGANLSTADVTVGPLNGYSFSTSSGGTYTSSLSITQPGGTFNQTVYVQFTPTAAQSYNGNIPVGGGGATATSVAASGTGLAASAPTVATAGSSGTNSNSSTLSGTLSSAGCATVTSYGFIYSSTSGFDPATSGTTVASSNLAGTTFSAALSSLSPSTTYYYVAFATNSVGTTYSTQAQFTTQALPAPPVPVATAATGITSNGFTANWDPSTGATGYFLDVYTQGPGTVMGGRIAGWDIPTNNDAGRLANTGTAANINSAELLAVNGGTVTYSYPSGPGGGQSTYAVSTTGWDAGVDTKYWMVGVNTTGASNITVSSLQASSNTGPRDWKIQYRVGNSGSWVDVTGGTVAITTSTSVTPVQYYGPTNLALPADAANQPLVQIRWVVNSTTAVNGTTVVSGGTSRISSVYVKGDYPGTVNTYVLQNQSVGNVTTYNVTGLTANTTYYYVVRADNSGSTSANSNEISVTTTAATPALSAGTLAAFGSSCINTTSGPNSFTVSGSNLTGNVTVGALAGYTYSTTSGGTYTSTLTLTPVSGSINGTVYVNFTPTAVQTYNGNIALSGGGAGTVLVSASGAGINTAPTVATGTASGVTTSAATLAGSISANGCSAPTAYGIVYSTTSGFDPASTGTIVAGSNLASGSYSVSLSGLAANTTYYYVAYATNGGGTSYGTQLSFVTSSNPSLSAGTLTAFGNTCINTTSTPNSFTVTGSNLTGNVTVNALAGYAYSTTSSGTYSSTLTLSPTSGTLNQAVYVRFAPTAVQSYNGNISVSGGGATAASVAASGAGINTTATVATAAATAVTATSATIPGTITATGCSNVTAYGVIYSTTSGFNPATTGTNVAGANLAAGAFSVALSSLTPSTTYYYVTYATNGGGTSYSTQQSFTTLTPSLSAGTLTAFGATCINTTSSANSFTLTGSNLTGDVTVGALAGYTYSSTSGGTYTNTLTLSPAAGALNQTVFVKFTPTAVQSYNGNISVTGGGATAASVAASGSGTNTAPTVTTGAATGVSATGATVPGTITAAGCSATTAYGVIYSTTSGFNPATTGTTTAASNLSGGNFSSALTGLTAGVPYYYVTFATNGGGTSYSTQGSFTTTGATPAAPVATAATAITATGFTANWNAVTGATGYFLDVYTLGSGSTTIAGWDITTSTPASTTTANQGNTVNTGIQQLTLNGGPVLATTNPAGPSGTTGTPNPYAVSASGWDAGVDTKYWMIGVNTTGSTGLTLSSLQGSSNTGPRNFKIQYRVGNAGAWIDVPGGDVTITTPPVAANPATFFGPSNLPLPVAAENQSLVQIRWVVTSTTSVNNSTVASGGTSRISGIYVKAAGGAPAPVYVTGYQNLSVGNVTSYNVTGLTPSTTYYYVVRATNASGTSGNSNEITVATTAGAALSATTLTAFGNTCVNATSAANSFTINGTNLTAGNVTVGPLAGYAFSTTSGGTYSSTLTVPTTGGTLSQQVFVQLTPTAVQSYNGNIPVSGGGASGINVAATGAGVNTAATVTAGAATGIGSTGATIPGTISSNGCSVPTAYGVIWSTTSGFDPATTGTNVAGSNLSGTGFSVSLTGLAATTTYYYVTYATNAAGTSYSAQQSFTTTATGSAPAAPVATAATATSTTGFTANWNAVTGATGYFLDVYTLGAGSGTQTISGWDMAGTTDANRTANQGNANNINLATLTATTGAASVTYSYPAGPSALGGTNPQSVSTSGWDNGIDSKFWMIGVNTTGATGLTISSMQGGSNTGPRDWKVQYRVGNAGNWTDVSGGTIAITTAPVAANPATFFGVTDLALPAAAENQPLVQIRWVVTSTTSVNNSTVASGGTSRMTAIYVKAAGGAATPVYVTGYQNLSVGNVTSYNVTGLAPNTTYYYVVRAANAAGTSGNSNEITVATSIAPVLNATTLPTFGNLCPNTTSTANSFTLTGSALQAGNVTVGPLAGYAFSTTSGGTYSSTLTIPTTGGALSQQVFVQLTPTAVQSYNGNIPVSGGGASSINVAATGAGANNAPAVASGAASNVTNVAATVAGTISNNGCTAVTAYGIEYSTTSGFANGTGTAVAGTGLAGGAFTSSLTGLTANTTYYYHAYATNGGGTGYGAQGTFTTAAGPVISLTASTLAPFGDVCVNTVSAPASFTITGANLNAGNIAVAATNGYQFATTVTGPYSPALALAQTGGSYSKTVFVQFLPTATGAYNGSIAVSGGGASTIVNVLATGNGIVTPPTVVTLDSSNISYGSVSLRGAVLLNGCSALTETGVEWSVVPNFTAGTGTQVAASGIPTGASYLVNLANLVPGMTYYYRAYARNAGATGYGAVKSVTLPGLLSGLRVWPMPVMAGQSFQLTLSGLTPGYHGIVLYTSTGAQVYRHNLYLQANYINERLSFPASLAAGTYLLRVVNNDGTVASQTIVIGH